MNNDIENRQYSVELQLRLANGDGRTIFGIAVPYNKEQRINGTLTDLEKVFLPKLSELPTGSSF
jgi:hypothetical protein